MPDARRTAGQAHSGGGRPGRCSSRDAGGGALPTAGASVDPGITSDATRIDPVHGMFAVADDSPAMRQTSRRALALAVAGVLVGLAATLTAAPATAHTGLVDSDPADAARLDRAPSTLRLQFASDLNPGLVTVVVTGADAAVRASGRPTVQGRTLLQPLEPTSRAGAVSVAYRVVSADGHPVSSSLVFTVAPAAAAAAVLLVRRRRPSRAVAVQAPGPGR